MARDNVVRPPFNFHHVRDFFSPFPSMPNVSATELTNFARQLLLAGGATADEAAIVAPSLVDANLRGYDSHGVMRIPFYIDAIKSGEVASGVELTITKEGPSRIVADANWGFGQVQMQRLMQLALAKTKATGLCVATMIHAGHIGRLGEYCEQAAALGLVSELMVNSHGGAVRVAPPGGKAPRLSTNPLAIGVPHSAGALSGGVCAGPTPYPKKGNCVFLMLLDPEQFGGTEIFNCEVEKLVGYVKDCPRVEGVNEILLPGDPERKLSAERQKTGIPLDAGNWTALAQLAEKLTVALPATM
jgi:LDH2 family malate/lactate/ureidoglycolate dehydrogenase